MPDQPESTNDAHIRQLNAYTTDPEYLTLRSYEDRAAFFEKQIGRRWEIDAAIYDEFLEMLPPLGWRGDTFFIREFTFSDITSKFSREGDRYFCEVATFPPRPTPAVAAAPNQVHKPQPQG